MAPKMKVTIQTRLACAASRAWEEVQKPRLLNYVASPLLKFAPLNASGFPEIWEEGDFFVSMFVFGFLPLGLERIGISTSAGIEGIFRLRDDGGGTLVRSWDHHITIRPAGDEDCLYCDTVDISAGALTPFVWIFAQLFYRWRQHRWRRLVASNFQYS
jgi:hypothetical protein